MCEVVVTLSSDDDDISVFVPPRTADALASRKPGVSTYWTQPSTPRHRTTGTAAPGVPHSQTNRIAVKRRRKPAPVEEVVVLDDGLAKSEGVSLRGAPQMDGFTVWPMVKRMKRVSNISRDGKLSESIKTSSSGSVSTAMNTAVNTVRGMSSEDGAPSSGFRIQIISIEGKLPPTVVPARHASTGTDGDMCSADMSSVSAQDLFSNSSQSDREFPQRSTKTAAVQTCEPGSSATCSTVTGQGKSTMSLAAPAEPESVTPSQDNPTGSLPSGFGEYDNLRKMSPERFNISMSDPGLEGIFGSLREVADGRLQSSVGGSLDNGCSTANNISTPTENPLPDDPVSTGIGGSAEFTSHGEPVTVPVDYDVGGSALNVKKEGRSIDEKAIELSILAKMKPDTNRYCRVELSERFCVANADECRRCFEKSYDILQQHLSADDHKILLKLKRKHTAVLEACGDRPGSYKNLLNVVKHYMASVKSEPMCCFTITRHHIETIDEIRQTLKHQNRGSHVQQEHPGGVAEAQTAAGRPSGSCIDVTHYYGSCKRRKQMNRLEKTLRRLEKYIEHYEQMDVEWDADVNSPFMIADRLKKRFVKVYELYSALADDEQQLPSLSRSRRVSFQGTRYPEINTRVEKLVNRTGEFPDFSDMVRLIEAANLGCGLRLGPEAVRREARQAFSVLGAQLQRRRQTELQRSMDSWSRSTRWVNNDPADDDPALLEQLQLNAACAERNMTAVFDEFSRRQETGDGAGEETDSHEETDSEQETDSHQEDEPPLGKLGVHDCATSEHQLDELHHGHIGEV